MSLNAYYNEEAFIRIKWSIITNAAIASTIGTALGTTHGSCLPSPSNATSSPFRLTVFGFSVLVNKHQYTNFTQPAHAVLLGDLKGG